MVLFFTATLLLSILGLVSLIALKRWELRTGGVLGGAVRPHVSQFSRTVLVWFERVLPALLRQNAARAGAVLRTALHRGVAQGVLHAEHGLERTLYLLRHTTEEKPMLGEASAFLREVAEHKKQLLAQGPGAITEE